jgi:hypothetical protein
MEIPIFSNVQGLMEMTPQKRRYNNETPKRHVLGETRAV